MLLVVLVLILILILFLYRRRIRLYNYDDLKNFKGGGIPKIIFKTSHYKMSEIPGDMMNALIKTQNVNPGYFIFYFDDDDVSRFMNDFSPSVHSLYKQLVPGAYKADFFRVCILYKYGGCYSDIGHVPLVSFDAICGDADIVLVNDCPENCKDVSNYTGIHNALMCSTPRQPYFKMCVDAISKQIKEKNYGEDWFDITGPTILGKVFNCYFHKVCDYRNRKLLKSGFTKYGDCKVKILEMNNGYIEDNRKKVVMIKFNNYHSVMYASKNIPRYNELWLNKRVYT